MNPAIPSALSSQAFASDSRPTDFSCKPWESSSFKLSDKLQEDSQVIPRAESNSSAIPEQKEFGVGTHQETMSRLRGLSRHRTSSSSNGGSQNNIRPSKHPSQKAMLSKALQKANTAVLLDNAQNFEVAKHSYSEACALLERVMSRSSGDDDRRKLEAIRNTYTSRISEIEKISSHHSSQGKALPERPDFGLRKMNESNLIGPENDEEDGDEEEEVTSSAYASLLSDDPKCSTTLQSRSTFSSQLPPRRESLHKQSLDTFMHKPGLHRGRSQRKLSKDFNNDRDSQGENQFISAKYSPHRSPSPQKTAEFNIHTNYSQLEDSGSDLNNFSYLNSHSRMLSCDSLSWLDTIDESGRSTSPSLHSRTSSMKFPRKIPRCTNVGADAEFDAALDAAVEAAYDESFMLTDDFRDNDFTANLGQEVQLKPKNLLLSDDDVTEQLNHDMERANIAQQQQCDFVNDNDLDYYEEDEQMLEEITKDYIMDDFEFGLQSKSTLPRESDSSGFSGRTWASSIVSNPTTASTITSTTSRACTSSQAPFLTLNIPKDGSYSPPLIPPPQQTLPSPPSPEQHVNQQLLHQPASLVTKNGRFSDIPEISLNTNQSRSSNFATSVPSFLEEKNYVRPEKPNSSSHRPKMLRLPSKNSSFADVNSSDFLPALSSIPLQSMNSDFDVNNHQSTLSAPLITKSSLRKNFSSSSLKNLRKRNVTMSSHEGGGSDLSPGTPMNTQYHGRIDGSRIQPAIPNLPTPISMSFRDKQSAKQPGNIYLLKIDIPNPESPQLISSPDGRSPISLEPCPNEYLLRPFWLMRALYHTITHPKGGYLSNKLFVPCDAWRVKGVKLKNIEDKISNCDLITVALLKISLIDTLNVDEMLDEMQKLEDILEQAQNSLSKKLGNEVGPPHGNYGGHKETGIDGDGENHSGIRKSGSNSVKSSFSWRRLRSKNSALGLSQNYSNKQNIEGKKDDFKMASIPMTLNSTMKIYFSRRDLSQINFTGPNANYMYSLARLFDASQIIDQIARQIELHGHRRTDKTLAGLELSIRHAAEFFSYYICRFVLNDIGLMLDKFVKKGGEWVLE
ncbi:putative mit domain-containing protein [Erysiphe necator]|uniref:Putative mit domain-containing protein n=1 Tax=Uncinula necator TaxID=52586 RepID=A0A0B1PDB3_UNCNE|nr:putative mit domain-containing protein [Erysiphe necator]